MDLVLRTAIVVFGCMGRFSQLVLILSPFALAACSASVAPSQLEPPAAVLLQPPPKLPAVKEGDDAVKLLIDTRRRYAGLVDRHKRLQRWTTTVLGK
jgi:hypothetical protein